jgi:cell division protein FtsQ
VFRALLALSLVGLGGEALYAAFNSPRLVVRRVRVAGTKTLSAEHVIALSGIPLGQNIFRTNLYRARLSVEREPVIHHVGISRLLPDTVVVSVRERTPAFTLALADQLYQVDLYGMIYRAIGRAPAGVPVLGIAEPAPWKVGQKVPAELLASATQCVRLARSVGLPLAKITVDAQRHLWLNILVSGAGSPTAKPLRVRLGRPEALQLKFADAQRVLRGAPHVSDLAAYLDVSCAGRPAYMAQSSVDTGGRL